MAPIWSEIFRSPTGQKVKPNMALRRVTSVSVPLRGFYVTSKHERPRRGTETDVTQGLKLTVKCTIDSC